MKITFELKNEELNAIITSQVKEQAKNYFKENEETFVRAHFDKNVLELKRDGFFKRQVSATLNKAIYDKVNREFASMIEIKMNEELDKVIKELDLVKKINKIVDQKVQDKLKSLIK